MSVEIRSRFFRPLACFSRFGDGTSPEYEERIVDGVRKLVEVGRTNSYDFIQKSLADTLVYNILDKFQRGNVDIINQRVGQYVDVTGLPKSLAEAENIIISSNRFFDTLPVDIKNKFNNSSSAFLQSVSDGSFVDKMPEIFKKKNIESNPVVKEDNNES